MSKIMIIRIASLIIFLLIVTMYPKFRWLKKIAFPVGLFLIIYFDLGSIINEGINVFIVTFGIIIGYVFYLFSSLIVNLFHNICLFPLPKMKEKTLKKSFVKELCFSIFSSIYEEFLWRRTVQIFLGNNFFSVGITSVFFTLSHFKRKFKYIHMVDIFIFSILLGIIYIYTENIWLISLIHFSRNFFVICCDYCLKNKQGVDYEKY